MRKIIIIFIVGIVLMAIVGGSTFSQTQQQPVDVGAEKTSEKLQAEIKENKDKTENIQDTEKAKKDLREEKEIDSSKEETLKEDEVEKKDLEVNSDAKKKDNHKSKKIFLTFDDGPTTLTPQILDVLKEHDVNATFFAIGRLAEKHPDQIKRIYNEGNMVLPHSYTHDYSIYSTIDGFYEDFFRAEETVSSILDIQLPPIFRFPGGSSNHSSFNYGGKQFMPKLTEDVKEKGYYYIDWNVSSGDAGPDYNNKEKMIENVLNGAKGQDFIVVLFHDVPRNTSMKKILPEVITVFKDRGYTFRTFRDITEEELNTMVQLKLANKPIIR
ncbi:Peptidoglycan/xylan/chitin deacetylase, PgdA/CDA1 family [Natronincola peptidivorans]|uniref:Peptidoglycan/xylan/chitin deacetylase, PgdA/CDA1 family n=1 Tax=Natronincola peptidivorans TaxID=426128 RepID=A0A1H9Y9E6_9FIRM|nr:polysaccharide deacetylase family protein [Natronincola peptidivorans]SES65449.1 Peptidoglycan/xylan/chitin deacetylase, PgdA/CDA1 family [Natronincola peptidivorans]